MAMIPLIAMAGVIQMSMLNGGYGDNEVRILVWSRPVTACRRRGKQITSREGERDRERDDNVAQQ